MRERSWQLLAMLVVLSFIVHGVMLWSLPRSVPSTQSEPFTFFDVPAPRVEPRAPAPQPERTRPDSPRRSGPKRSAPTRQQVPSINEEQTSPHGSFEVPVNEEPIEREAPLEEVPRGAPTLVKTPPRQVVETRATVLREVRAPYPPAALSAEIEGVVTLRVRVDVSGHVVAAAVLSGPGYGLDEAAREAILRFVFTPSTRDGVPFEDELTYRYVFNLE